jgi:D-alanyl-lipoteichoic acid acyltransferase DltB (MBOAT superfamily)
MRPLRSFLLLLIFLACFTGLHYIIPANQLFPSIYEFIPADLINDLFSDDKTLDKTHVEQVADTIKIIPADIITPVDSVPAPTENLSIDPLRGFLDSLRYSRGQLRIMYYGDSQIEGDRITSFLRQTLRKGHGGTGPGLFLPLMPVMYTESVWLRSSSNWERYNYLSYKTGEISHRNLGPFMAICRYLPEGERASVPEKAFVRIRPSNVADSASSEYDILRVFYGNTEDVVNVVVKADDNEVFADTLKKGKGFNEITCPLKGAKDILIKFAGKVSPDIYGISIESKSGVIVDNIPQRGSAGLEFTMVDRDNLTEAYKTLSPDLFILHYGLNIVKNVRENYSYYQKGLGRQLSLLKEISPSTPILVISLTDMAVNEGDSIKSYRNIPAIIDAQKQATLEAGAAFWDSYSAMGGESSIIKWAEKKPPLAQKDYVHFTYPGADTLSKILADAMFSIRETDTNRLKYISIQADTIIPAQSVSVAETLTGAEEKSLIRSLISSLFKYNPDEPFIFTTPAFWLFFLLVLAGYSLIYKKLFIRNAYLFLVSLFFYYKSGGLFLFLLIFVTLIDFTCGLLIHHSRKKFMRRLFILLSIISNLGILAYFKYTGFFVNTINDLFGTDYRVYDFLAAFSNSNLGTSFNISNIILPVGISFFTFQSLSYIFDVYRRKMSPVRNIIDFGFYVSFFPQLVAGPIVRASEFIPQLYSEFHLSKREFSHALFMISKGLIKKIIISDFIAISFIDRVFDAPSIYSGFENLMAVYGYGLQIYCDFSGYTDIAIGLGLILGFRLPVNFNSPYKAAGIADFWKRWHISLSRWLKDYLYIPLGGNRKGKIRTNINLMITMLLGGLWHGAALRFVIWGALHGLGLVINRIWNSIFGDRLENGRIGRALAVFITFQFVSFCWIFFRAPDMDSANTMLKQIIENFSPGSYMTVLPTYSSVFLLMVVGYVIHFLPERIKESYRGLFIRIPLIAQLVVIMLVAILLFQMRTTEVMPFIYFRF